MLWFNASNAYEAEPNDTAKDATFIANGQSVNGFLQSSEEDFYYIDTNYGTKYVINKTEYDLLKEVLGNE